ncbi:hypothetical protein AB0392_55690 [Nonomuraea angiospora]|uniref:hypothetical protein n=1 Tax=Nonomuraea angiospora TaxID=46172 RepID=UPI00344FE9AE
MSAMPSPRHDALVKMFEHRPELAVEILRDLMGVELPDTPLVRLENTTFNTRRSDDIHADMVLVLGPSQDPAHAIIVEIQQDKSKAPRQLARYAAVLWLMLGCDVTVGPGHLSRPGYGRLLRAADRVRADRLPAAGPGSGAGQHSSPH